MARMVQGAQGRPGMPRVEVDARGGVGMASRVGSSAGAVQGARRVCRCPGRNVGVTSPPRGSWAVPVPCVGQGPRDREGYLGRRCGQCWYPLGTEPDCGTRRVQRTLGAVPRAAQMPGRAVPSTGSAAAARPRGPRSVRYRYRYQYRAAEPAAAAKGCCGTAPPPPAPAVHARRAPGAGSGRTEQSAGRGAAAAATGMAQPRRRPRR